MQLVDDQLINMEVPPVELILTDITKLFSDLTAYVGVPDVQGLLVLDFESGDFIQAFDMLRIPQGMSMLESSLLTTTNFSVCTQASNNFAQNK